MSANIPLHVRLPLASIEARLKSGSPQRKKCRSCSFWMLHEPGALACRRCEKKRGSR